MDESRREFLEGVALVGGVATLPFLERFVDMSLFFRRTGREEATTIVEDVEVTMCQSNLLIRDKQLL